MDHIVSELARAPWSPVKFRQVMDRIGIRDDKDFKRRIRRHEDFINALAEEGIEEWTSGKYPRGYCRKAVPPPPQQR